MGTKKVGEGNRERNVEEIKVGDLVVRKFDTDTNGGFSECQHGELRSAERLSPDQIAEIEKVAGIRSGDPFAGRREPDFFLGEKDFKYAWKYFPSTK